MWPLYYPNGTITDRKQIRKINDLIENIDHSFKPFIQIQDYINLFDENTELVNLTKTNLSNLAEKCVQAFTSKGYVMFNETLKSKYIVTDLIWFTQAINLILNSAKASIYSIEDLLPENTQIWKYSDLKETLSKLLPNEEIDKFIDYLIELNLILKIRQSFNQVIYLLPIGNIPKEPFVPLVI